MAAHDDPGDVFYCVCFDGDEPPSRLTAAAVPRRPLLFSFLVLYLCYIVIYMKYISSARMLPIATQARRLAVLCLCTSRPRVSTCYDAEHRLRPPCLFGGEPSLCFLVEFHSCRLRPSFG